MFRSVRAPDFAGKWRALVAWEKRICCSSGDFKFTSSIVDPK